MQGYRTYLAAGALVAFGVLGLVTNHMDSNQAVQVILEGLGLVGLRLAISAK